MFPRGIQKGWYSLLRQTQTPPRDVQEQVSTLRSSHVRNIAVYEPMGTLLG